MKTISAPNKYIVVTNYLGRAMKLAPILFLFIFMQVAGTTACSKPIPDDSVKRQQTIERNCKPLYTAVEYGEINLVKKIITIKTSENQLDCIKYALQQNGTSGKKNQFQAFRYLVDTLVAMQLPDQQSILNKTLKNYVIKYLSHEPEYTEYLLSVGALPKNPDEHGKLPVASALWAVNDLGNCKTPSLLINASSPEILANQNKTGETALIQSIIDIAPCFDELNLLAQKSAGINLVDQHGNTALHYVLMEIKGYMDSGRETSLFNLALLRILHTLRKRGASTKIPNKKSITPAQLLRELKSKGCKC
jgi:hypothetical protein